MLYNNAIEMIGNTPILKLNNLTKENSAEVYVKLEKYNPGGSIKDRAALGMIERAEKEGLLKKGGTIIEPTSGNTGIALAFIGKLRGYKVIIVMPETMSVERRNIIKAYGAELYLTPGASGMKGAILKAQELAEQLNGYIPQQFINEANPAKHYATTADEIIKDLGNPDAFIAGVGTGGTVTGVGRRLKEVSKTVKVIAVEPAKSAVISGNQPGPHKIQGIGAGFIPENYDAAVIDEVVQATDEEAFDTARKMAEQEGILVGISSGANISIALKIAEKLGPGKKVVTVAPDSAEKYLSMGIFG